jgi:hypothetical protein
LGSSGWRYGPVAGNFFRIRLIEFSRKILCCVFSSCSNVFVHAAVMFRRFYDFTKFVTCLARAVIPDLITLIIICGLTHSCNIPAQH